MVESHAQNVKSTHIVCTKKRNDDDISIVSITFCDSNASAKQAIMIEKFKNFWFFLENYQPDKCKIYIPILYEQKINHVKFPLVIIA